MKRLYIYPRQLEHFVWNVWFKFGRFYQVIGTRGLQERKCIRIRAGKTLYTLLLWKISYRELAK